MAVAKLQKASLFGAVMQQAVLGAKGAHRLVEKGAEILLEQGSGQQLSEFRQRSFQILLEEELCVLESGSQHSLIPSLHTTHTDTRLEIYLLTNWGSIPHQIQHAVHRGFAVCHVAPDQTGYLLCMHSDMC